MMTEHQETEIDRVSTKLITQESLCSSCKNEIAADEAQNEEALNKNIVNESDQLIDELFAANLDDAEEISRATRSLSTITIDCVIRKEENDYNEQILQLEQDYLFIEENINDRGDDYERNNNLLVATHDVELNNNGLGEKALVFQSSNDNGIDITSEFIIEQPIMKQISNKNVQTDDEFFKNQNEPIWDPEFPSEKELNQIEHIVREATITNGPTCKRKLNFDDDNCKSAITKRSKKFDGPNFNAMVSIKLNREKRLADLSNDLYELSSYLNDVRQALSVKEPKTEVKIPSPPKLIGYDSQFDCLHQSRFAKLPIAKVESVGYNKSNGGNESQNHKQQVKTSAKKNLSNTSSLKNAKGTNNNKNVSVSKKNFYQTTLKEAFSHGKENKNVGTLVHDKKKSLRNNYSSMNNNNQINGEVKSLDSTSMYDFNPLRASTVVKNK